jgi:hypothetical protein
VLWSRGVSERYERPSVEALRGSQGVSNICAAIDYQGKCSVASDNTEQGKLFFIVPPIAYLKYLEHIFQK